MAKILNGRRGAWVTVTIEGSGQLFIVTGRTGYRAELRACLRDECQAGTVTPCAIRPTSVGRRHAVNGKTSVNAWLDHIRTHCHGWHWPSVEAFAERVLKTYETGARWTVTKGGVPQGVIRERDLAPCPDWPA